MFACLLLVSLLNGPLVEPPFQKTALAATARLRARDHGTASAVAVGRKNGELYLLTAEHALYGSDSSILAFEFFAEPHAKKPAVILKNAKTLLRRPIADFALITVLIEPEQTIPILRIAPPGKAFKRFPEEALSVGCSRGDPPSCEREIIQQKRLAVRRNDDVAFFWQAEKSQAGGRSGGPLLNGNGQIIGICAATSLGRGYYTHLSEIHAALKTEGYDWLWTK